jgi:hypothetical protein
MVWNPVAKALSSGICRSQVIRPKKGRVRVPLVRLMPSSWVDSRGP